MKKKEKKNKGFSLVELIVVVLIIGVIGIALAPQVIKWVDESKTNTDRNNAESLQASVQAALIDWQNQGGKLSDIGSSATAPIAYTVKNKDMTLTVGDEPKITNVTPNITLLSVIDEVTGGEYPTANTKIGTENKDYIVYVYRSGKVLVSCSVSPVTNP